MDHPAPLDALVLLEIQEILEQVVHQDLRDLRDCQDRPVVPVVQEVQGLLDRSGLQVLPEPLAVKVLLVPRVSRDQTEIQDQQVPQDRKEYKALPDMQVCQGSSETLAQLVPLVVLVSMAQMEEMVLRVLPVLGVMRVLKDHRAQLVVQGHRVRPVPLVPTVYKVRSVPLDLLVTLGPQANQVRKVNQEKPVQRVLQVLKVLRAA